jgi:hypothetical protein
VFLGLDLELLDDNISRVYERRTTDTATTPSNTFPYFYREFVLPLVGLLWVVTEISLLLYRWIFNIIPHFGFATNGIKDIFEGLVSDSRMYVAPGILIDDCALSEAWQQQYNRLSDAVCIDEFLELRS